MKKLIIEARINEYMMRDAGNPNVPYTPEEIAAAVPEEYLLGDKALYMLAVKNSKPTYSLTGLIPEAGMKSANDMLVKYDEELKGTNVDLSKTFIDSFAKKASSGS